jgi:hypothetical protein
VSKGRQLSLTSINQFDVNGHASKNQRPGIERLGPESKTIVFRDDADRRKNNPGEALARAPRAAQEPVSCDHGMSVRPSS